MGTLLLAASALLTLVVLVAVVLWRRRDRSPAAEYRRNMRSIRLDTYGQIKPRYTRQVGEPKGYEGGTGPPMSI